MIMGAHRPIGMGKRHFAPWRGALVPQPKAGLEAALDCLWALFMCANQNFQLEGASHLSPDQGPWVPPPESRLSLSVTSLGQLVTVQVASVC